MFDKSPAKTYHSAVSKLKNTEGKLEAALDAYFAAKTERRANDVPGLRRKAKEAEESFDSALSVANEAWRSYWLGRRAEIEPQLKNAVRTMREYDAYSVVLAGNAAGCCPAKSFLENFYIETPIPPADSLLDDSGVPVESPDSDLTELRGEWR